MSTTDALDERGCPTTQEPPADADVAVDPAAFVRRTAGGASELELLVTDAHCAGCIAKIERGLKDLGGVGEARLNLSTHKLRVEFDAAHLAPRAITGRLAELGYRATPFDPREAGRESDQESRRLLRCMAVAGFAAANVMLLSVSVWSGHDGEMAASTRGLFHWITALIALPAAAYAGRPFFESALRALRAGRANMDVPISLAVVLALALSIYESVIGGRDTYFDAAVMLLFFLLAGRWLDHRLRGRARAAAGELLALQASTASRIGADGAVTSIATGDIAPGDRLLIAAGDRSPVDVVVEEGVSDVDMSLATGETAPVTLRAGDALPAGVVNLTQRLVARAQARAQDSFLAELARLIEAGEQARTRYVRLADRAAQLYVPLVHGLALATFAGWMLAGAGLRDGLTNAIALLIITCPCALGLAVPAVQVVATGRLFRRGVLVKTGDALERLAGVDHVVFDKTGTLTTGRLTLANRDAIDDATLETAALLARTSRHPVARAVADLAGRGALAEEVTDVPGQGVEAIVEGRRVRFGRASFVGAPESEDDGAIEAWLGVGEAAPVRFVFADTPREGAARTLNALRRRGLGVEMLTGDRDGPARALADQLGLTDWRAQASPTDKTDRLAALTRAGRTVLMVGDGLNDAPALAQAHVSISLGSAAEASQHAADLVLQKGELEPIAEAVDVARAARRRVLENFGFAAAYNALAVPLAALGFVTPLIAALAMSSSSLVVTLNAARLARGSKRA